MIELERSAAEKAARREAQQQADVQEIMQARAIDNIESEALAVIQQRLQQGKGAFEQTDREQGPFSGYQDPVQTALNAQSLKGAGHKRHGARKR